VRAAQAVGYTSAGTLEYLVSGEDFFFLEMNTRIQVEHTVTEAVTGMDLVREQVRIAAGEPLSVTQERVAARGHAFECRINAEDASQRFLPTPGFITAYREPSGPGVRVDSGVRAGSVIPEIYDPMVAKLITWDVDRDSARRRMLRALDEYVVEGPTTLIPFHRWLLTEQEFIDGGACHDLLASLAETPTPIPPANTPPLNIPGDEAEEAEPTVTRHLTAEVGGRRFEVTLHVPESQSGAGPAPAARPKKKRERSGGDAAGGGAPNEVVTPMQGTVLRVLVEAGQEVAAGDVVAIVEAMKMENEVPAHRAGTVGAVAVTQGQPVQAGEVLATID
jgi:acetyl-CoA/propionyl-CoA carboxylase, biotin carboxylase, biotin carboxyl carrier protein